VQKSRGSDRDPFLGNRRNDRDRENRKTLGAIARVTDPSDDAALAKALMEVSQLEQIWELRGKFFDAIREKVKFDARAQYIKSIATAQHLNWFWKMAELGECKKRWTSSSASIGPAFSSIAIPMLRLHSDAIVEDKRFSGYSHRHDATFTPLSIIDKASLHSCIPRCPLLAERGRSPALSPALRRTFFAEADNAGVVQVMAIGSMSSAERAE